MGTLTPNLEAYAKQCEAERAAEDTWMWRVLADIRARVSLRLMGRAARGRLERAAYRSFGANYTVVDCHRVQVGDEQFVFSFKTGRFYGLRKGSSK